MYDISKIKKDLKTNLSVFRYSHTIRVAEEAKNLAKHYGYDEEKAYVAALLHDIAKEFTEEENAKWIEKYQLPDELLKKEFKNIVHADIGAVIAKEYYQVDDDIYNAIKYHTIGNVSMDILAKIIFIADKIGREDLSFQMKQVKTLSYQDLNKAILLFIKNEKQRLESKGIKLHPNTLQLLNIINKNEVSKTSKK